MPKNLALVFVMPLQGEYSVIPVTQGVALGYYVKCAFSAGLLCPFRANIPCPVTQGVALGYYLTCAFSAQN